MLLIGVLFGVKSSGFAQETPGDPAAEAVSLFNRGQEAHEKGDLRTALEHYRKAIELIPEFPEAEYQSGHALISLGRNADAEAAFRNAVRYRGDWTLALAGLGSVLVTNGKYDEAEKLLTKALELDGQNFPAFVSLVELNIAAGAAPARLEEMLARATALTAKASPTASLWTARAALERVLGRGAVARTSITKALDLEPGSRSVLTEAIAIALAARDTTRAEQLVARLESKDPDSANTKLQKAKLLAAKREFESAAALLRGLSPRPKVAEELLATIEVELAISPLELEKRLATEPANAALLGRLCEMYRRPNPAKALEYCRRAAEAEPAVIGHAIGFAAALVQAKRYDEAVGVLRKLIEFDSKNATIRANLAAALFQLQRFQEAKSEYRWLLENNPNLFVAYYFLAISHDRLGEYPDAMANYVEFLKRADATANKDEIERVNLRLPTLRKQVESAKGAKRK